MAVKEKINTLKKCLFVYYLFIYLFIYLENASGVGQRERWGESQAGSILSTESDEGLNLITMRS